MNIKIKYVCRYCGERHNAKWIKEMNRLGLEIRHLSCKECGEKAIEVKSR
jgi:hypothetical protein